MRFWIITVNALKPTFTMSCWVGEVEGVVAGVAVAVETLRVSRIGYNGIGRNESVRVWQIIPGIEVQQPHLHILFLPGKGSVRYSLGGCCATPAAKGQMTGATASHLVATAVTQHTGTAQMVGEEVVEAAGGGSHPNVVKTDTAVLGAEGDMVAAG